MIKKKRLAGIYRIVCLITLKCYVGQAFNINYRKCDHLSALRHNRHWNKHLQAAFNKYGEENFIFEILEIVVLPDDFEKNKRSYKDLLCTYEQKWMDFYNSANPKYGYNNAPSSGSTLGFKMSEETRQLQSKLRKGKPHPHTEEQDRKLSISKMGHEVSPETRQKISESKKGVPNYKNRVPHSEETKKKIGDANRNRFSPLKGKTYEELYGVEDAKERKEKIKKGMNKNTL